MSCLNCGKREAPEGRPVCDFCRDSFSGSKEQFAEVEETLRRMKQMLPGFKSMLEGVQPSHE